MQVINDLFYQDAGDSYSENSFGEPVYRRKGSGFSIVTLGRDE